MQPPEEPEAAELLRQRGLHVVEDQLNLQPQAQSQQSLCRHGPMPGRISDRVMGLTQEVAELLTPNGETGMWPLEDLHTLLIAVMPVDLKLQSRN